MSSSKDSTSSSSVVGIATTPAPPTGVASFMNKSHSRQHQRQRQHHNHIAQDPHQLQVQGLPDINIFGSNAFPDSTSDSSPDRRKIYNRTDYKKLQSSNNNNGDDKNQDCNNNNNNNNENNNLSPVKSSLARTMHIIPSPTKSGSNTITNECFISEASQSEDAVSSSTSFIPSPLRYGSIDNNNNNHHQTGHSKSSPPHHHQQNYYHHHEQEQGGEQQHNHQLYESELHHDNTVVGGDINIQLRKSASNTSLSSLGSPSGVRRDTNINIAHNLHHNSSSKNKGHLYFPMTTTSLSSSSFDHQQHNEHQYPMESLLGPLDSGSGSISEAEEILRMNGGGDDKNDDNGNNNDDQNGNEGKQMKDERDAENNGGGFNASNVSPTKEVINIRSRKSYYISPRPVPIYAEDYKTNDNEVDTFNSNNEGRHTSTEQQQQHQQKHPKPPLSDDLSETDSASHEQDILHSILSSSVSSLIELQKSTLSEERSGNNNIIKQKTSDDDDDDDGISYDTASSQGKPRGYNSVETDKISSPPQVDNQADILADVLGSPDQVQEKTNQNEDENDSVTPKRKTIRIGGGNQNIASETNDERKRNCGEDESIKPRAQRKRIYSDGKRAPKHRRKKSGDDVAATLLTGSADWIGMELHKLPLPSQNDEDEDDEEDIEKGTKGEEIALEESASFGNMRSEERANRRSRRKIGSESPMRQLKEKGGDAWMTLRGNDMPVAEFSKYAQSTEDNDSGMNLSSRFVPRVPKEEYIPKETSMPSSFTRHESIGTASVSSTGSQGTNTSAFSWISNRISLLSVKDDTERSDEIFSGLDNSAHNREPIHYTPIPEDFTNNTVGQAIDIQEQQRKNAAAYDAHMMTLNDMQPYPLQPVLETDDCKRSFICPRCNTRQREFFTVATVPKTFENPISFMVVYFVVYVILALFIFGVEEGWPTLDCVYFSVMTLTTIGLGDYVPTSNSAKIVCSIFMYFGIACFGLILGLLHANSLDHASRKAAEENMISSCPNCCEQEEQTIPKADKKSNRVHGYPSPRRRRNLTDPSNEIAEDLPFIPKRSLSPISSRRSTLHTIDERPGQTGWYETDNNTRERDDHSEDSSQMSTISLDDKFRPVSQIKAAKYIFLTLKQAFANTLFIIGSGSIGFMYFERMTTVDAFYFTTSLLTTVGYGDIIPKTSGGKVFASGYAIIAWIFLLYNISMISMIPLELRKRRIEHAVLIQFGEELDDATLHELISGPLVRRITGMTDNYNYPMDHCTREMFALTMLVRLGRITEQDIRSTFAAFQKLDKNNDGILTSKQMETRRGMGSSFPQDSAGLLPRQRVSNSSLSESSALLHPLSTNIKTSDEGVNYMSTDLTAMSTAISSAKEEVETSDARRLMRSRGMSLESLWSTFTDENWDDNP